MEIKKVLLKDVKLKELKQTFNRLLSTNSDDLLNVHITTKTIMGVSKNAAESLYKRVEIDTKDLVTLDGDFPPLKLSLYKGKEFVNKTLSFFGEKANITLSHNNGNITELTIARLGADGKSILEINIIAASVPLSFPKDDPEQLDIIFNPTKETLSNTIELSPEDLKQINQLSLLNTNPEAQTDYIQLLTEDGKLIATDNAFKIALYATSVTIPEVDVSKELFAKLDSENQILEIHDYPDNGLKMMLSKSTESKTLTSLVLLSGTDESEDSIADFDTATNWEEFE